MGLWLIITNSSNSNPLVWVLTAEWGNLKRQKGDLDGAVADFNKAIELNPNIMVIFISKPSERERR